MYFIFTIIVKSKFHNTKYEKFNSFYDIIFDSDERQENKVVIDEILV